MVTQNLRRPRPLIRTTAGGRHGQAYGGDMRTPWHLMSKVLLRLAIGFLLPVSAFAQTGAGSLTGIVSDQSGAKVPGATVTAINQATNVAYTTVSNEAGNYSITSVPVGTEDFGLPRASIGDL